MRWTAVSLALAVTILFCGPNVAPAHAQTTQVFVSGVGDDKNPCTIAKPCRTFQRAHDIVAADGEINALDPANYGLVNITKGISIEGHGFAGILVGNNNGICAITVSAGSTDKIHLRGLLIDGQGGASTAGVNFGSGNTLSIEDTVVRNAGSGINFFPSNSANLFVSNTLVADRVAAGVSGISGIDITTLTANTTFRVVLDSVQVFNNQQGTEGGGDGIVAITGASGSTIDLTVARSVIAVNSVAGVHARPQSSGTTINVFVDNSTISNNQIGVFADGQFGSGANISLSRSVITQNITGWSATGSNTVSSYGDNKIDNNGSGNNAPTSIPPK
jgi:hypothetical protein